MLTRRQFVGAGLGGIAAIHAARVPGLRFSDAWAAEETTVREAIAARRTVRDYSVQPIAIDQTMALLWAAQGITDTGHGYRSAPSAGALYPLEVFLLAGEGGVNDLSAGTYRFRPDNEELEQLREGDHRRDLAQACMGQNWVGRAPASLVLAAVYSRIMRKYANRGITYAHIEAGCAAQNVLLMAVSLGLSAGIAGALAEDQVETVIGYTQRVEPLVVLPFGHQA